MATPGSWRPLWGDGRLLLGGVAFSLPLSGAFAVFQSATGRFLPHDVQFLGMDKEQLCGLNQCRVVHSCFMTAPQIEAINPNLVPLIAPDRAGFGGAIGIHPLIGYTDATHLAPAYAGAVMFAAGALLSHRGMIAGNQARTFHRAP